jgi:phosphotransferase system IIB component
MDMMALNPVTGTHRQYVPQNERDIQETRVHSVVHDMAINCQDAIEKAIKFMGQWTGKDYSQVQVILNTEFSNTKDRIEEVKQLVAMYEKRGISRETLLREVYKRNLLGDDFNMQNELAALAAIDAALGSADPNASATAPAADPAKPADPAAANSNDPANGTGTTPKTFDFPNGQDRPKKQI